ncbi:Uncharacterized protein APZ42_034567 [Daphnia magna]|uniref:ISXO2-like transposase domain-containing protein n=1 Tax=Daphnia magna TaxID=35525 RepID=A0A164K1L2_9CRUS|nr:Uncharacterized protein APZ42_034567 [Daphnia magna]
MGRRQNLAAAHPHRELITDGPYSISVDAIKRLVSDGILPHRNCSLCNQTMALHQSTGYVDGCYWKCTYRNPKNKRPCKGSTSSVRTGTLYERSRLSIPELTFFFLCFFVNSQSYSQMKEKMKIANNETIGRRTKYLREVVFHLVFGLSAQFTQIGKYRRGNYKKGEWVFGGVERGTNRCFLVIVPDRKRKTLLAIIKQYIAPGTTIISDEWRAYKCLG